MAILTNSRNSLTDVVTTTNPISGQPAKPPFVDLRQRVTTTAPDDKVFTVGAHHNWATLGSSLMGDARFWWIIADLSGVVDPFTELKPGVQMRSPSQQRFLFTIMAPEQTTT